MEPTQTKIETKKGYEFLRELCAFKANFNAFTNNINPITNRVEYIITQLIDAQIPFEVDKFQPALGVPDFVEGLPAFVNVYVQIEGTDTTKTTVFLAHHDVANMKSQNAQDNSASIANLLDLACQLTNEKPVNNVVIAFVDAEEIVCPQICGAKRLSQQIKSGKFGDVKFSINLELTAQGNNYWMSYNTMPNTLADHITEILPTVTRVNTPYSDTYVLEMEGLVSVCVGSLNDLNLHWAKQGRGCKTWMMCHSPLDTFESQAVEADMDLFVGFLKSIV